MRSLRCRCKSCSEGTSDKAATKFSYGAAKFFCGATKFHNGATAWMNSREN